MTRRALLAASAVFVFWGLSSRAVAQVRVSAPAFGTARGGDLAAAEWKGLPAGVDELELLLSVEGRDLPLRLTPRLSPQPGLVLWRVPNILSRRARLRLRFGLEGEEVESTASAEFEILPAQNEPPAALAFHDGEWWVENASAAGFPGALGSPRDGGRLQENRETPPCAASSRVAASPSRGEARPSKSPSPADQSLSGRTLLPRKPIEAPRRL
jgi:hypothetical protein